VPHVDARLLSVQITAMLAMAIVGGQLARRMRLPAIFGELLGGIVLGPTIFGTFLPGLFGSIFPQDGATATVRDLLVKLGMLCFLFVAGLEVDVHRLRALGGRVAWTSLCGIAVPFALGWAAVTFMPALFAGHSTAGIPLLALFLGTALSISALPVIARILMDLGLQHSTMGTVVLASATIDDLIGWSLFATILAFAPGGAGGEGVARPAWQTVAMILALFIFALTGGRWIATKLRAKVRAQVSSPPVLIGIAGLLTFAAASLAEWIGVHAVLGAFAAGLALSRGDEKRDLPHEVVYQFAMGLFAPLYFVSLGLKTNFAAHTDPGLVALVLVIACVGKIAGATLGGFLSRTPLRESLAVGFGMNARGAMEMILASIALERGLIDETLFVALVTMAVVTSLLSGPVMVRLLKAPAVSAAGSSKPRRT
jgi:Kef-type K+ transport system membrane component KefB